MKRKMSVFLAIIMMLSLVFSFGASAVTDGDVIPVPDVEASAVVTAGDANLDAVLALGMKYSGMFTENDTADTFTYTIEDNKGYVCFAIEADENAETVKGGWTVEIYDAEGKLLRSTDAVLDEEGELPNWKFFASCPVNGTYTVKVVAADESNAPIGTEYTLRVEQFYKNHGLFDKFLGFDLSVFEWVQGIQNKALTAIFVTITTLGDEGIIFIAIAIIFLFTKKYRKIGFAMLIALGVMTICNNLVLKELVARPRPYMLYGVDPEAYALWGGENAKYFFPHLVHYHTSYSFPSGHTSSAFAAAFAILFYNKKIGIPMTVFAALMGFSRIYVEVHYCTDVIAGAVVGLVYAFIGFMIVKLVYPYFEKLIDKLTLKLRKEKKA